MRHRTPQGQPATASNTLRLNFGDVAVESRVSVPAGKVDAGAVLPALQGLVNDVVAACERREQQAGRSISCRKGCGACCRQLVPIAPVEARAIGALVRNLPAARRSAVEARFQAVRAGLEGAGLLETLLRPGQRAIGEDRSLGQRYFALGLPCPFLEDESCSIHQQRPLACREYLVTSPAERCAHPQQDGVVPVSVPKLAIGARGMDAGDGTDTSGRWLPLSLALEWNKANRSLVPSRSGPDWFQRFLSRLHIPGGPRAS